MKFEINSVSVGELEINTAESECNITSADMKNIPVVSHRLATVVVPSKQGDDLGRSRCPISAGWWAYFRSSICPMWLYTAASSAAPTKL